MKNIINLDFKDGCCIGTYSSCEECNQMIMEIRIPEGLEKPCLYFIKPDGSVYITETLIETNDVIRYEVPFEMFITKGELNVELHGIKNNSNYVSDSIKFKIEQDYSIDDDLCVKYNNNSKMYIVNKSVAIRNDSVIVSPTEPEGINRKTVWFKNSKNLFDKNNYYIDSNNCVGFNLDLEIGETYTISSNKPLTVAKFAKDGAQADQTNGPEKWGSFTSWTFVAEGLTPGTFWNRVFLGIKNNNMSTNINDFLDYNIQIEKGSIATSYEEFAKKEIHIKNDNGIYERYYSEDEYVSKKGGTVEGNLNVKTLNDTSIEKYVKLYRHINNANEMLRNGYYSTNTSTTNLPSSRSTPYGIIVVEVTNDVWSADDAGAWIWQTFKNTNGEIWTRFAANASFSEWKKLGSM